MAATQTFLHAACLAVLFTQALCSLIISLRRTKRAPEPSTAGFQQEGLLQRASRSKPLQHWTMRVAVVSILLGVCWLFLYWITGYQEVWAVAAVGGFTLGAFVMFLRTLGRLVLNRRVSLARRLARSTALVLAAAVAFVMIYCKLARV